jgi:DNA-binding NarL/FixJ family response regulator
VSSSRVVQPSARRETLTREAARRQAVATLHLASAIADYAARSIADGLSPQQARAATADAAAELAELAALLRRLTELDLDPAGRRALAVQLAADGLSHRRIAAQIGRSKRTVWGYLHGRS